VRLSRGRRFTRDGSILCGGPFCLVVAFAGPAVGVRMWAATRLMTAAVAVNTRAVDVRLGLCDE